jgi:hypothetical protein
MLIMGSVIWSLRVGADRLGSTCRFAGLFGDFKDSFGKGRRRFLRQIVPDAALDEPVCIFAREFLGVGTGIQVWCTIGITFEGNGGHGDYWTCGKALLEIVIFRLAFC